MKAIIFCAGLGTRFKPWTDNHPKALAEINGKSLLQRNVEYLRDFGITDVVINVHHFAEQIEAAVQQADGWGSSIKISDERDAVLETGGGLVKARALLQGEKPFVTLNADVLTDLDLHEMLIVHKRTGALITLATTQRPSSRKLLFNTAGKLCGWRNTVSGENRIAVDEPNLIEKSYSGIAVYSPAIFPLISQRGKFSVIDVFLDLAKEHLIAEFDHTGGKWIDVGKPESVAKAEALFE